MNARRRGALIDAGLLIALFDSSDPRHTDANAWVTGFDAQMVSVAAALAEAAHILPPRLRPSLADLVSRGILAIEEPDRAGHRRISAILRQYEDLDPDWADACLVWAAEQTGIRRIVTVDETDFSIYRISGRTRFEIVSWGRPIAH